jgi:hypothetical protein
LRSYCKPPNLERAVGLEIFRLEIDIAFVLFAVKVAENQRGFLNNALQIPWLFDVFSMFSSRYFFACSAFMKTPPFLKDEY